VLNPALLERLPEELRDAIDAARVQIRAGELRVPRVAYVEGEIGGP